MVETPFENKMPTRNSFFLKIIFNPYLAMDN